MNHILHWCQYRWSDWACVTQGLYIIFEKNKENGGKNKTKEQFWLENQLHWFHERTYRELDNLSQITDNWNLHAALQFFHRLLSDKRMHQKLEQTWEMSWAFSQASETQSKKCDKVNKQLNFIGVWTSSSEKPSAKTTQIWQAFPSPEILLN